MNCENKKLTQRAPFDEKWWLHVCKSKTPSNTSSTRAFRQFKLLSFFHLFNVECHLPHATLFVRQLSAWHHFDCFRTHEFTFSNSYSRFANCAGWVVSLKIIKNLNKLLKAEMVESFRFEVANEIVFHNFLTIFFPPENTFISWKNALNSSFKSIVWLITLVWLVGELSQHVVKHHHRSHQLHVVFLN